MGCLAAVLWGSSFSRHWLSKRLEIAAASGAQTFDFAAETTFDWERMYVFGCYAPQKDVERVLGFAWPDYRKSSIGSSDAVCLVVCVKDRRVVDWYEQSRRVEIGDLVNDQGYARSEATFNIVRLGDRYGLLSRAEGPARQ